MKSKVLLVAAAAAEFGTGFGLLLAPSLVCGLLLGEAPATAAAVLVARVAGTALMAIGLACWLEIARRGTDSPRGLLMALLLYNVLVAVLLAHGAVFRDVHGVLLWPLVVVHAAFAIWCGAVLKSARDASRS